MNVTSKCGLLAALAACAACSIAAAEDSGPDWLLKQPRSPLDAGMQSAGEPLLVLQRERTDGAELLTVRVPIAEFKSILAYAGAGLNRTVYFAETSTGETFTTGHGRHRSLGAAAELGAEWRVTERFAMAADLRWIDIASDASLLRSGQSLVAADPLSLGVSLGWRFR
jgi:hypothetical protein